MRRIYMTRFEMTEKFNQEILGIDPKHLIFLADNDVCELTTHQLKEEADEFLEATKEFNSVEAIDALIDSIYYAYGALYKMGVPEELLDTLFKIVHEANMKKALGKKRGREEFDAADASKPDGWESPESLMEELIDEHNNNMRN